MIAISPLVALLILGSSPVTQDDSCDDRIPSSVISSVRTPGLRQMLERNPRWGIDGVIREAGGVENAINLARQQIAAYQQTAREAAATSSAGMSDSGQKAKTAAEDGIRVNTALLNALQQCRAGGGSARSAAVPPAVGGGIKGAAASERQRIESENVDEASALARAAQPAARRGYERGDGGTAGGEKGLRLNNPFDTSRGNECDATASFEGLGLNDAGSTLTFTIKLAHSRTTPCTMTFDVVVRAGTVERARVPARTVTVPPDGLMLQESILLVVPVETSTAACDRIEPTRRALLDKRDQLAASRRMAASFADDTLARQRELERSVGLAQAGQAIIGVGALIDGIKAAGGPQLDAAFTAGECVAGNLAGFVGQAVASCTDPRNPEACTNAVLEDGSAWAIKTVACAAEGASKSLDRVSAALDMFQAAGKINDLLTLEEHRRRVVAAVSDLSGQMGIWRTKLSRMEQETAIVDSTLKPLEALCRSPQLQVTHTTVHSRALPQ